MARYTFENLVKAFQNPSLFKREFFRIYTGFDQRINNKYHTLFNGIDDGIRVVDQDWDNLIIMDACRADLFEDVTDLKEFDDYTRKISADSNTSPWTAKNFHNRDLGDVVYVSGNPVTSKVAPDVFHALVETWTDRDAIDEDTLTVPPGPIIEDAYEAIKKYPNKRLIVHFNQPHYPFIPRPELTFRTYWVDAERVGIETEKNADGPNDVWGALRRGIISRDEAWEGYQDNLEYILPDMIDLARELPGKSVVSSDHGNMLGDRTLGGKPIYGHPGGYKCPELVTVPWAVIDGERRKITDDGVHSEGSLESDIIEQRLAALGYVE